MNVNTPHPVKTWADGFGRWHAEVTDTRRGLSRAVRMIASEIHNRESDGSTLSQWVEYVEQNIVSIPSDKPGLAHFAEYAID